MYVRNLSEGVAVQFRCAESRRRTKTAEKREIASRSRKRRETKNEGADLCAKVLADRGITRVWKGGKVVCEHATGWDKFEESPECCGENVAVASDAIR